jgi:hypothetical protein
MTHDKVFGVRIDVAVVGTGLVVASAYRPPKNPVEIGVYLLGGWAALQLSRHSCMQNIKKMMPGSSSGSGCGCSGKV